MENLKLVYNINDANAITHNGKFHIDEVFSTVLLTKIFDNIQLMRISEIPSNINLENKIIYDIGKGKFDHHQNDAITREDGIKYCSFGLLWKEYGKIYLEKIHCKDTEFAFQKFDLSFIKTIDKIDNFQIEPDCLKNYLISDVIESFNSDWNSNSDSNAKFQEAVEFATKIFDNNINKILSIIEAKMYLKTQEIKNETYILLKKYVPYNDFILENDSEEKIKFVIYPSKRNGYEIRAVLDRTRFPKEWFDLSEKDFFDKYKVNGMLYCHSNGKLCIASNIDTAISIIGLT